MLAVLAVAALYGCAGNPASDDPQPDETVAAPDHVHKAATLEAYNATVREKDKIICKNEPVTGSRMYRKSCYTVAHRDNMEAQSKDWLRTRGASGAPQKVVDPADPRLGK